MEVCLILSYIFLFVVGLYFLYSQFVGRGRVDRWKLQFLAVMTDFYRNLEEGLKGKIVGWCLDPHDGRFYEVREKGNYFRYYIDGRFIKKERKEDTEMKWCIYGDGFSYGIGKIEKEDRRFAFIRYSERQMFPPVCWDKSYVKKFSSLKEAIKEYIKLTGDTTIREKVILNFPSERR